MMRNGLAGAALLIFLFDCSQWLAYARRGSPASIERPIQLDNHGQVFHVSEMEALAMGLLLLAAVIFFAVGWIIDQRLRQKARQRRIGE